SDTVSGGTGPHYYQELYASPHHPGRLYLMSNTTVISYDFGKTFVPMSNEHKHGDDHAIAFRPDDKDYLMLGSDGGLYETFDHTKTWRFIANMPITQFYKVAVDDDEPFYNVYGGTQDNNSQGGPSRTDNIHGIRNSDWFITLFGDGHDQATEPGNPDIVYSEWQQGNLVRYDRTVGEIVYIKPQGEAGDPPERFNWDAPILISPHSATRLYFASQRVWRSDDRGDTWTTISGDLTRDQERLLLPIMGRQQSWDSPWDMLAMSQYNTITSLAESPVAEGVIYAGTDDGLIQITTDGGSSWREVEVGDLPGVPDTAFVNDIKADLFDAETVYVALDNHKYGDYAPYLLKSTDGGRRWTSIASDIPDKHLVWRVVQDHVSPGLLFAGTEFGIFFTVDGGERWIELNGGVPTISFRDLEIQRRENDLVGASFGRSFYILDDYSPLREVSDDLLAGEGALFAPRRAWWYLEQMPMGGGQKAAQGHGFYTAANPPFGAVFTYYLPEDLMTAATRRQEAEKQFDADEDIPFPGWDAVVAEQKEPEPEVILSIRDADGNVVRRLNDGPTKKGFHRIAWDLRGPATQAIGVQGNYFSPQVRGMLLAPGTYSATLATRVAGETSPVGSEVTFEVERMTKGVLHEASADDVVAFWQRIDALQRQTTAIGQSMPMLEKRMEQLREALSRTRSAPAELDQGLEALRSEFYDIRRLVGGTPEAGGVGHLEETTVGGHLFFVSIGTMFSTYGPTPAQERGMDRAEQQLAEVRRRFIALTEERIPAFEKQLSGAGAPWVPGMPLSVIE
ncbi:MAG: glycosyl hydrolase, partial [Pseudomonadota bacterium]